MVITILHNNILYTLLLQSPETETECNSGNSADEESDNEEPLRRFGGLGTSAGGAGGLNTSSYSVNSFCDQGIASINIDEWISFKMDDQVDFKKNKKCICPKSILS